MNNPLDGFTQVFADDFDYSNGNLQSVSGGVWQHDSVALQAQVQNSMLHHGTAATYKSFANPVSRNGDWAVKMLVPMVGPFNAPDDMLVRVQTAGFSAGTIYGLRMFYDDPNNRYQLQKTKQNVHTNVDTFLASGNTVEFIATYTQNTTTPTNNDLNIYVNGSLIHTELNYLPRNTNTAFAGVGIDATDVYPIQGIQEVSYHIR